MELKSGTVLNNKYIIEKILSMDGGFSIVYLAEDVFRGKKLALKELYPKEMVERKECDLEYEDFYRFNTLKNIFETESRILAMMDSNSIVSYVDYFEENNTAYIAMEYAEGISLKDYIKAKGKLGIGEALKIFNKVLDSLEYMHSRGVIHRDIKPANIIIKNERKEFEIKIIDFGSACIIEEKDDDFIRVSRGYSPLEMYATESEQNYGTDIYSIFATLCHMLEGRKIESAPKRIFDSEIYFNRELCVSFKNLIFKNLNLNLYERDTTIERVKEKLTIEGLDTRAEEIKIHKWVEEY